MKGQIPEKELARWDNISKKKRVGPRKTEQNKRGKSRKTSKKKRN